MSAFAACFAILIGEEGGLTTNPADAGNWTGGKVGAGRCVGSKYGLSAASFPNLDIPNLTLAQAMAIYLSLYWNKIAGNSLPAPLALLVFDAAVNNGVNRAVQWMQAAADTHVDGVLGPATLQALAAASARDPDTLLVEYQTQRLMFMIALPTWRTFGLGWARRLCGLPFRALPLFAAANSNNPAPSVKAA